MKNFVKATTIACLLILGSTTGMAQFLRTTYFMENATNRLQLNPALRPAQGFIEIPVIGALHAAASSNTLGVDDIIDIIDSGDDYLNNNKLFDALKPHNRLNVNLNTDIISFGFYKGKGFWSANIGIRTDINANIPKALMEFARYGNNFDLEDFVGTTGSETFDIKNGSLYANTYTEIGLGYSRQLTDKLTVGAKAKFLLGVANMDLKINQLYIKEEWNGDFTSSYEDLSFRSHIKTDATLNVAMAGVAVQTDTDEYGEYISDVEYDKFGIAGYGFGIDLGATYQILDNFTVSASLIDLGLISWNKNSTTTASSKQEREYDTQMGSGDILDFDILGYNIDDPKAKSTSLASTLVFGAEYGFLNNKLSAGLLSTTWFGKPETLSEITLSANYRPKKWFNASLSYSFIQSDMKTFGVAFKIGPLFIGTDYMYLGKTDSKNVNAYLGISIPLGGKKTQEKTSLF